jgi:hypothetical protein
MAVVNLRRIGTIAASAFAVALLATSCSNANSATASGGGTTPTGKTLTVGAVASMSGAFSQGVGNIVYGEKAYFDMIDAQGGVDGYKINLPSNLILDDGTNPTTNANDIRTLVAQDNVFSLTVGSAVFDSSTYLGTTNIPVFGYNEGGGWSGTRNLFAQNGDLLYYPGATPGVAYMAKQLHLDSVAIAAYGFDSASKDACATLAQMLPKLGVHVGFEDLNLNLDEDPTSDVSKMAAAHVDMLYTCTDGTQVLKFVQSTRFGSTATTLLTSHRRTRSFPLISR